MTALVKTSGGQEEFYSQLYHSTNEAVPLLTSESIGLTSQERLILAESTLSVMTETSDQLFERIRREAVQRLASSQKI